MSLAISKNLTHLYRWTILPFLVMQIGIFPDYWPFFKEQDWGVHIHYWTASLWFIFLIIQPILIAQKNIALHRTMGIFGFMIAGGVIFSAISLYTNDIKTALFLEETGQVFGGFLEARSFTSILVVETMLISAFGFTIVKSVLNRKNIEEHAWWLMCSSYTIMLPTVGRGMFYVSAFFVGSEDNLRPWQVDVPSSVVISGLALLMVGKFHKWRHPASWIAILITPIAYILWYQLTQIEAVHHLIKSIIVPN